MLGVLGRRGRVLQGSVTIQVPLGAVIQQNPVSQEVVTGPELVLRGVIRKA